MKHKVKIASDEEVKKITNDVIAENKNLLKRLEKEEQEIVIKDQVSYAGEDSFLEHAEITTTGNYITASANRNKIELIS
ncbi:MAG TPA: hypothetical protein OQH54_03200 [Nitrosopumilus sp.]|nr:hypothetical protein [Thermoproteota archaeon]HJJ22706.1 hypothetical protein [Nitrosopumilus sp.]